MRTMGRSVMHISVAALLVACLLSLRARAAEGRAAAPDSLRTPALRYLTAPSAEWSGDSLVLKFSCIADGRLKGAKSIHVEPLLVAEGAAVSYPGLSFYTPSEAKFFLRRQTLSGNGYAVRGSTGDERPVSSRMHIAGPEARDSVFYREAVAVPSTLKGGRLCIVQKVRDCCAEYVLDRCSVWVTVPERASGLTKIEDPAVKTELLSGPQPLPAEDAADVPLSSGDVSSAEPESETARRRSLIAAVRLSYPVGRWEVYPDFKDNASELQRLDSLLYPIICNTDEYRLSSVTITGYASPEGTFTRNLELSGKRAGGIRDYLMKRYGLPSSVPVSVSGAGEDWDGLRSAVEESDIPEKADVLSIIDGCGIFEGRELRLMNMRGGQTYRRMLRELFPPLRRVEVKLDYTVLTLSRSEAEPGDVKSDGEEEHGK